MFGRVRISSRVIGAAIFAALVAQSQPAVAQDSGGDGYLFHAPRAALSIRLGAAQPAATGRIFDFTAQQLKMNRSKYLGFSAAADLDVMVSQRVAIQFGGSLNVRNSPSEYRNFVDNKDLPIEQSTEFRRAPVTAGVKIFLRPPGRSVGRFAWVPNKVTPYVSAGGGAMYYSFVQSGDFIDFKTNDVFATSLESRGWAPVVYGAGGVNYAVSAHMDLVTEARYESASAQLGSSFQGFGNINLSGLSMTAGLHLRF